MSHAELLTPADLYELATALAQMTPRSRLLAGGTDLVNALRREGTEPDLLVDLSDLTELHIVSREERLLHVGSMVTFSELQADRVVRDCAPCLAQAAAQVGSVQIRNLATVGGNVASASPCGDSIPALMALEARVTVLQRDGTTSLRPIRDVVLGPGTTSLALGEAIVDFVFAPLEPSQRSVFVKIGSRSAVSVARLSAAVVLQCDGREGTLSGVRVALGAVGATAFRDPTVEASLEGAPAGPATARRFADACADAISRSIPGRPSLPYKRRAALGLACDAWNGLGLDPRFEPDWV